MNEVDNHTAFSQEAALRPHSVLDKVIFGRRLRALRILEGYDRAEDFCSILSGRFGVEISPRSLYAIERGEQMPHFDLVIAVMVALKPAPNYFSAAFSQEASAFFTDRRVSGQ